MVAGPGPPFLSSLLARCRSSRQTCAASRRSSISLRTKRSQVDGELQTTEHMIQQFPLRICRLPPLLDVAAQLRRQLVRSLAQVSAGSYRHAASSCSDMPARARVQLRRALPPYFHLGKQSTERQNVADRFSLDWGAGTRMCGSCCPMATAPWNSRSDMRPLACRTSRKSVGGGAKPNAGALNIGDCVGDCEPLLQYSDLGFAVAGMLQQQEVGAGARAAECRCLEDDRLHIRLKTCEESRSNVARHESRAAAAC